MIVSVTVGALLVFFYLYLRYVGVRAVKFKVRLADSGWKLPSALAAKVVCTQSIC